MVKKLMECFIRKNYKKADQIEPRIEEPLKGEANYYMPNAKILKIHLIVGLIKSK